MRRARFGLGNDTLHFLDFLHQVQLRGEPSGCICQYNINAACFCCADSIEYHRRRIALLLTVAFLRYYRNPVAFAPGHELLASSCAKGIAGGEQHGFSL